MTKPFFDTDIAWCPGCGNHVILRTFDKAVETEPDLKRLVESDPQVRKLIDIGRRLDSNHPLTNTPAISAEHPQLMA